MREFKKYFFEGLLQLSILAALLRHNSIYLPSAGNEHLDLQEYMGLSIENEFGHLEVSSADYLDKFDLALNTSSRLNDEELRRLSRLNARIQQQVRLPQRQPAQRIIVAPSYFYLNNSNQKDIINLSETRLLLNSIEFNNNQLTKEVRMWPITELIYPYSLSFSFLYTQICIYIYSLSNC